MRSAAVRFGVLGTAHITPVALLRPARLLPGVDVVAIAARDEARATRFAARFGIPRVHRTYAELVEDPQVDAVYVPLPNSLHAEWAIHALQAGKHVLCEKPLASNAAEAKLMIACVPWWIFVRAVRSGERLPADAANGLANMRVIDEIYRQAGLPPRGR